ncbi:MAG TPA: SPOR domain-containing protein [Halanaerobiaceae bacterium]|jgi:hypothetical protein|nr:SPOR domain-containing protein [Bacillota bacterium]HHU92544.1 SPOR domain-containing protein [Halanaerobiaceae bacterium]HOA41671.1 SPOR domain-containing protein [Halanaerobiales bacterium]HPZ63816.1 SPOR domain-containing protein [Halanaerobiales bacterium]HQD05015.1 SPOR domain-containing protein [Halanaerobiales bacterium]
MDQSNSMSLKVLVIVLALFALLVGYLMGNWVIQLVTGDSPNKNHIAKTDNKVIEEEIILKDEKSQSSISGNYLLNTSSAQENYISNLSQDNQMKSREVFVIQVGAFNNRRNAEILSQELASKGFQTFIADESLPYKVQIGAFTDRKEAEEIEREVKALGYEAFITH